MLKDNPHISSCLQEPMQRQNMSHSHDGDGPNGLQVIGNVTSFRQSLPSHIVHAISITPGHLFGMHPLPNLT